MMIFRQILNATAFLLLAFTGSTVAAAETGHPFHSTYSEMEWNAQSSRFEVALQLPGLQIDEELSRLHKRRINVETTEGAERLLEEYVKSRFSVSAKGMDECRLHWVGMEISVRDLWVYFEVELIGNDDAGSASETVNRPEDPSNTESFSGSSMPKDLSIESRFLIDTLAGQSNSVTVINGTHRTTAQLTAEAPRCVVTTDRQLKLLPARGLN